ncbi:MAG: hypothetical protein AAGK74_02320 [Chloroflexota bacterium]
MHTSISTAQDVQPLDLSQQSFLRSDRIGITFVAHIGSLGNDAQTRYRRALELGAGWTRYPIYWSDVERTPNSYTWEPHDRLFAANRRAGLETNAILMNTPGMYRAGDGGITGVFEPVFSDGTDTPGAGKTINPNNPWAEYVFAAVNRYKPGGTLSQQEGWTVGEGIRVWEMWNEPDLGLFWSGGKVNYARLQKVGYLATKHADPGARVMFGGLAYGNPDTDDWLADVLRIHDGDPGARATGYYMDIVGLHSYNDARRTGLVINRVKDTLAGYGLATPIWLNEFGVPVWDDYPGPIWAANEPGSRTLRATQEQQAAYAVQASAYAFAAGAEKIFWHQLYDDCGNSPGNHSPDERRGGDAFGFFRNPADMTCYSQHPNPGTPRLSATAYQMVSRVFGSGDLSESQVSRNADGSVFIRFQKAEERITVMWSERTEEQTISFPALTQSAQVFTYRGAPFQLTPSEGRYSVTLPPARPNDDPQRPPGTSIPIGGTTYVMVEGVTPAQTLVLEAGPGPTREPRSSQIGSVLEGGPTDTTLAPISDDLTPPVTDMVDLPETSPVAFNVRWTGADNVGIERYLVWVRINDGEWQPWLETTRTDSDYVGVPGNVYAFAVWAVDAAGNWSLNTDLQPQTFTVVQ